MTVFAGKSETEEIPGTLSKDTIDHQIISARESHPILVRTTEKREEQFEEHRANIASEMQMLDRYLLEGNYIFARMTFAGLRKMDLLDSEAEAVISRLDRFDPKDEAPFYAKSSQAKKAVEVLDADYTTGVPLEAKNETEVLELAQRAAKGEITGNTEPYQVRSAVTIVEDSLGKKASHTLLAETVTARIDRLYREVEDPKEYEADTGALLEAIDVLRDHDSPQAAKTLFKLIDYCIEPDKRAPRPYYVQAHEFSGADMPSRFRDVLTKSAAALNYILERNSDNAQLLGKAKYRRRMGLITDLVSTKSRENNASDLRAAFGMIRAYHRGMEVAAS